MPTQRINKSLGCFRVDCRPNKYFSFQLAYVDFGQKYIICFVSYAYVVFPFLIIQSMYFARALTAQSNQNIRMKMGVADIRLVHSIVVNIVDESKIFRNTYLNS